MRRSFLVPALSTLFAAAMALGAREARADVVIGAGVGVAVPISVNGYQSGIAFDGRLGYEFALPLVALTVEAAGGYTTLPVQALTDAPSNAKITRLMGGVHLGFGTLVVPFVAAHLGYGWLGESFTDSAGVENHTSSRGFAMDAKIGFDARPVHFFSIGANGGYNLLTGAQAAILGQQTVGASGAINYLSFGLQAAVSF